MNINGLQAKYTLMLFLVTLLLTVVIVAVVSVNTNRSIQSEAEAQVNSKLNEAMRLLETTNTLKSEQVKGSMALLQNRGKALGTPYLGDSVKVGSKTVSNLVLGDKPQANNYDLVDSVTDIAGGTATLFALNNSEFVRISTNVMKSGKRATGTILAPGGLAIKAIQSNKPFYGQVDILGSPYLTGYAPIYDDAKKTIGIWYVGYKADLAVLENVIAESTILEQGFMAIIDDKGRVRMHSKNLSDEAVDKIVNDKSDEWQIEQLEFSPWRYSVVAAYPKSEIRSAAWNQIFIIIVSALVLVLVLVVTLSLLTKYLIVKPIQNAMSLANNIAKGHLHNEIDSNGKSEIGQLMTSLSEMQNTLKQFVGDTIETSDSIDSLSAELVTATSSTREGVNGQQVLSEQVATAMTEMSSSVSEVATNAADAANSTKEADVAAIKGRKIVKEAVSSIEALASEVEEVGNVVSTVAEDTASIGGVLDVIRSIAEQTNLLALNAAIEAARAGEQGRGFAVVADEVRTLASRTQDSTEEIQNMIQRLQDGSQKAEAQVASSQRQVQNSVTHVTDVSDSLSAIADAVTRIADMNGQIAHAAEQQATVAEEVNRNVVEITQMADATSENAQKTERSADEMSRLSSHLRKLVGHFRS